MLFSVQKYPSLTVLEHLIGQKSIIVVICIRVECDSYRKLVAYWAKHARKIYMNINKINYYTGSFCCSVENTAAFWWLLLTILVILVVLLLLLLLWWSILLLLLPLELRFQGWNLSCSLRRVPLTAAASFLLFGFLDFLLNFEVPWMNQIETLPMAEANEPV